jgi:hypothetical protein
MSLLNLQTEFAEGIFSDVGPVDCMQPALNMTIYRNNIITTLVKTLTDIYPLIVKLVGADFFRTLVHEYISRYPSRTSNLHDYGQYFSDFLAECPLVKDLVYLPEMANVEWVCHTLHFAAEHAIFDFNLLKKLTLDHYDNLHFVLHPACQIIKFHCPILRIIDLCKNDIDEEINLNEGGVNLLIIRRDMDILLTPLSASEFTFLTALQDNKTISECLQEALSVDSGFNLDEKLPAWIKDKTIVDCYLSNGNTACMISNT